MYAECLRLLSGMDKVPPYLLNHLSIYLISRQCLCWHRPCSLTYTQHFKVYASDAVCFLKKTRLPVAALRFFAPTEIAPARLVFAEACCESESFLVRAGTRAPKHSSDTERPYSELAKQTANLWATNLLVMRVGCCRTRSSSRPSQSSSRLRAMSASWLMTPNASSRLRNMENSLCRCRVLTRMASVIRPVETRSSRVISGQGITNLTGGGERREETRLESEK